LRLSEAFLPAYSCLRLAREGIRNDPFFARSGYAAPLTRTTGGYLPDDVGAWDPGRGILHIGIVNDRLSVASTPLVVHNIGAGAREEDILFRYAIIGHYRLPPPASGKAAGRNVATH
jgi:uncharacterized protein YijF (DUF1287 family)